MRGVSLRRFIAIANKEFIQMRRDKVTIAMLVTIPLIQLILFGYAINVNPRHLPTAIVSADHSVFTRQFVAALQNTKYFDVVDANASDQQATELLKRNDVQFVVNIPQHFTQDLIAGKHPQLLVTADATDSSATGNAISALSDLSQQVFALQYQRGLSYLAPSQPAFQLVLHRKYNPDSITQYNIVPGLMGVILTMTLVMITALAVTKESEWGTMESLLATPVTPLEVMLGKITPYILVGYVQQILIWVFAQVLFAVPSEGSLLLLLIATLPFIAANLAMGLTFSTVAENQLQAVQMSFFFFLPSILLSGFMFPFNGMPTWARWLGEVLPLTHFNRIVRGVMLKGSAWTDVWPDIWPILLFILVAGVICVKRYRQTLD